MASATAWCLGDISDIDSVNMSDNSVQCLVTCSYRWNI